MIRVKRKKEGTEGRRKTGGEILDYSFVLVSNDESSSC